MLKLNDSKTEFLQFLPYPLKTVPASRSTITISTGDDDISPSGTAKNLALSLDDQLSLNNHIMNICEAANFQPFGLSQIRKYLTPKALCIAVHALIFSRIDYCNSVLIRLLQAHISKLQHNMNSTGKSI